MSTVILIVDDEPGIPKAIKEYLEDAGDYRILVATDGEHGLAVLEEQDVAVCIVDMRLPGMSGNEFIPLAHACVPDAASSSTPAAWDTPRPGSSGPWASPRTWWWASP